MNEVMPNGKMRFQELEERKAARQTWQGDRSEGGPETNHNPSFAIFAVTALALISFIAGLFLLVLTFSDENGHLYLSAAIGSIISACMLYGFASVIALLRDIRDNL